MDNKDNILEGIQVEDSPIKGEGTKFKHKIFKEKKQKEDKKIEKEKKEKKPMSKKKKTIILVSVIVGILLILTGGFFGIKYLYENGKIPGLAYVAKYKFNNKSYTVNKTDFETYYKIIAPQYLSSGYKEEDVKKYILNQIVSDDIIVIKAKVEGIKLTTEDLKTVDEQLKDEQVTTRLPAGVSMVTVRKLLENGVYINKYIEKLASSVSEEDAINYGKSQEEGFTLDDLKTYKTKHILFRTQDDNGADLAKADIDAKYKKAIETLNRIKAGEDFATLAKELSEDTGSAPNGGVFEYTPHDSVVKEYTDAVNSLKAGELYQTPVKSEFGYHIIKLDSIDQTGGMEELKKSKVTDDLFKIIQEVKVTNNDKVIQGVK